MDPSKAGVDVAKPGSTPADATSRPLIVTKSAMIKDPMVQAESSESAAEPAITPPSVSKKTIEPLTSQEKSESVAETTPAEPASVADESEDSLTADNSTEISPTDENAETKAQVEEDKRQAIADELIKQKKYVVPIGAVTRRKAGRRLVVSLVLIILLAAAGVAVIDAGLIATSIQLPFDFIK